MSNKKEVIEVTPGLVEVEPKFVYAIIPAEYVCVYHRILAMLADYGEEMLKDCKATCKDRNSGVIECFNMFNAAVAARQLGDETNPNDEYTKLAATLIKYIKAKINQIYKGKDNSTSFVFPVDENGELKAFVSCGNEPKFMISEDDKDLYMHKFNEQFDEHFYFGDEDYSPEGTDENPGNPHYNPLQNHVLQVSIKGSYERFGNEMRPCADVSATYDNASISLTMAKISYYFDDVFVNRFNDVTDVQPGYHKFTVVVRYKGLTDVAEDIVEL